jgi:transcriptional regulator with XRE-family HTH domain
MGMKSHNAYARYEQGKAMPTLDQLNRLFLAVCGKDFVLTECATPA